MTVALINFLWQCIYQYYNYVFIFPNSVSYTKKDDK